VNTRLSRAELTRQRMGHAEAGRKDRLAPRLSLTLSEALVIGPVRQNVRTSFTVLGHSSTEVGEVLRIYQDAGLLKVLGLRSEIEASHAATALR
jgi:3D-(3,5/4)-trihydroxycyclohexane-1,2-dione acylhydrolase (decyclizing)